jgi:hypothetical protein
VLARAPRGSFIAVLTIGLLAGCGGSTKIFTQPSQRGSTLTAPATPAPPAPGLGEQTLPTPGPTGIHPAAAALGLIRAWSDALRRGDVHAAARYFALPSLMINGTDAGGEAIVITIGTRAQAEAANESLPCGARFISADQRGRYVNALFRLTGRPGPGGSNCDGGAGQTARTNFVIAHGLIEEWLRAPDDPRDNGGSTAPGTPVPPTPAPQPSGPNV